jgi:hypothetical protein
MPALRLGMAPGDYFVDVGRALQDEIISRTAHETV